MRIAVIQLCAFSTDFKKNLAVCQQAIEANCSHADAIFFPEASDWIGSLTPELKTHCFHLFHSLFQRLSKQYGIWLFVGLHSPCHPNKPDKMRNSLLVFDSEGTEVARYDKIHLFDFGETHCESKYVEPGDSISAPVELYLNKKDKVRVGLAICYDVRFPELAQCLRFKYGANVILYPSAFTAATGRSHWMTLIRSRAIETQCFVIAAAHCGRHDAEGRRKSWGQSLVVGPSGEVLLELPTLDCLTGASEPSLGEYDDAASFVSGYIDLGVVSEECDRIRNAMPLHLHKRIIINTDLS